VPQSALLSYTATDTAASPAFSKAISYPSLTFKVLPASLPCCTHCGTWVKG